MDGLRVLGFRYVLEVVDRGTGRVLEREERNNLIPQAGIDFLIQTPFGMTAPIGGFYCGLFRNNYLPTSASTAVDIPGAMGEFTGYSEASRPSWDFSYDGAGSLSNQTVKAVFTPTQEASIQGSFLVSSDVKGGDSGLLLSVVRFSSPKQIAAGNEVRLFCGLTYIPASVI